MTESSVKTVKNYMALLRNLRNILKYNVSKEHLKKVCDALCYEPAVSKSKQLPFRFWSAYRSLIGTPGCYSESNIALDPFAAKQLSCALEKAIKVSVKNLKGFDENTRVLIASDVSGSMLQGISPKSTVQLYDIGLLLGQLFQTRCKQAITGFFGDSWKVVNYSKEDVLSNTLNLRAREGEVGYSTNGYKVVQWLNNKNIELDKVLIFTDCQLWNSGRGTATLNAEWAKYTSRFPKAKLYLFDLAGSATAPLDIVEKKNVFLIAGWSEKIFEVMEAIENGGNAIDFIRNIVI